MKKFLLVLTSLILCLSACSNSTSTANSETVGESETGVENAVETETTQTEIKKVIIACSPVPHAEIMEVVKPLMAEKGFDLEIKEYSDYVLPNIAVDDGDADANYFQHKPYLDDFNAERGTNVVPIATVHYEPFGIYAGTKNDLSSVSDGDKIAVPNDVTNEARALNLLEAAGVIKLKEGVGLKATILDIVENKNNVEIVELEAASIPRQVQSGSVAYACMNGNYAMEAGYEVKDALFIEPEDSEAAKTYANVVCVKSGNENADFAATLKECIKSQQVKDFIDTKYEKSVIYLD